MLATLADLRTFLVTNEGALLRFRVLASTRYDLLSMSEAAAAKSELASAVEVSQRLEKVIAELRNLHELLLSGEGLDARILTDFRDALNRVRNTAWSAQQYLAQKTTGADSAGVLSLLTGERVRVAYQLCQALQADLKNSEIKFQTGPLIQLYLATKALTEQLGDVVGKV